jgi:hypothetical protein
MTLATTASATAAPAATPATTPSAQDIVAAANARDAEQAAMQSTFAAQMPTFLESTIDAGGLAGGVDKTQGEYQSLAAARNAYQQQLDTLPPGSAGYSTAKSRLDAVNAALGGAQYAEVGAKAKAGKARRKSSSRRKRSEPTLRAQNLSLLLTSK